MMVPFLVMPWAFGTVPEVSDHAYVYVPGSTNAQCNEHVMCVPGYTQTVRPAVSYTNKLKHQQMLSRHLDGQPKDYELDHRVPLEVCGNPEDPDNLWIEPLSEAREKDQLENRVHECVCDGTFTLQEGQMIFLHDWWPVYDRMQAGEKCPKL